LINSHQLYQHVEHHVKLTCNSLLPTKELH